MYVEDVLQCGKGVANGAVIASESAVILNYTPVGKPLLLCFYLQLQTKCKASPPSVHSVGVFLKHTLTGVAKHALFRAGLHIS
jgi:hypothetical protein